MVVGGELVIVVGVVLVVVVVVLVVRSPESGKRCSRTNAFCRTN